jgi:hypothetical protein
MKPLPLSSLQWTTNFDICFASCTIFDALYRFWARGLNHVQWLVYDDRTFILEDQQKDNLLQDLNTSAQTVHLWTIPIALASSNYPQLKVLSALQNTYNMFLFSTGTLFWNCFRENCVLWWRQPVVLKKKHIPANIKHPYMSLQCNIRSGTDYHFLK